jgi:asparagine synthase (glutamine-hydrolysing)
MAVRHNTAVRQKLVDIAATAPELLDLYLQRRRAMSNRQLAELGLRAEELGLHSSFEPPSALQEVRTDVADPIWSVSQLETRFYQHNMLLRDGDANSMAHSLEVRFPFLDRPVLDLAFSIPGSIRLPHGRHDKHLLRVAFADVLRPALLNQRKMGFTLPIRRWMLGALRDRCETSMRWLKQSGLLRPQGVDAVWNTFLAEPESPVWTRAFALAVLGSYLAAIRR